MLFSLTGEMTDGPIQTLNLDVTLEQTALPASLSQTATSQDLSTICLSILSPGHWWTLHIVPWTLGTPSCNQTSMAYIKLTAAQGDKGSTMTVPFVVQE